MSAGVGLAQLGGHRIDGCSHLRLKRAVRLHLAADADRGADDHGERSEQDAEERHRDRQLHEGDALFLPQAMQKCARHGSVGHVFDVSTMLALWLPAPAVTFRVVLIRALAVEPEHAPVPR